MHLFWQRAMYGGFTTVVSQNEKGNNRFCSDYDPTQKTTWLMYLDAVSLYASTMAGEKYPTGNFQWVTDLTEFDPLAVDCTGDTGYLVEATFTFPEQMHGYFADFPPCPVKRPVSAEELSPRSEMLATLLGLDPHQKVKKLVADLHERTNYVLPLSTLQFVVGLGVELISVTRVMSFSQAPILAPYLELCLRLRAQSKTKLESDILKLAGNSVFGFTLRDCLNELDVRLVYNEKAMSKLINSPRYEKLKKEYGDAVSLVFSDTDSIVAKVEKETEDSYSTDLIPKFGDILDTRNYDPSSPHYSLERKKRPGCFTDELGGRILEEIVCLKPKSYCCKIKNAPLIIRSEGVPMSTQKLFLFEDYKKCLLQGDPKTVEFKRIGRKRQRLYTFSCSKIALSSFENKRFWLDTPLYRSLPFGHAAIKTLSSEESQLSRS
ncbi:hypothetical protein ONE63_009598 [Megalurothrips usitatus]|uniref:DNA-directed DNA polymerase n=1 Tax=Megalurothrips usitatus TaxID=439358 RepID=A0AAV7XK50_9NEOP|nr:hypothetical protein ONE63_009598 [Megalurothrips usitatus]